MFAIGARNEIASVAFNPVGMSDKMCDFVGERKMRLATGKHLDNHITIAVEDDPISSEKSPLRQAVNIPGRVIVMEGKGLEEGFHPIDRHLEYRKVFRAFIEEKQRKMLENASADATEAPSVIVAVDSDGGKSPVAL
jgi:hypothetical protein